MNSFRPQWNDGFRLNFGPFELTLTSATWALNGFGTSLISRSLAGHGGNAELDFNVSGVICKISLPLA
jgi:hypothetical protein